MSFSPQIECFAVHHVLSETCGPDAGNTAVFARRGTDELLEPPGEVGPGREAAVVGDFGQGQLALGDQSLCAFDPAFSQVTVRRGPGRGLESSGEMERTEPGLGCQGIDRQVFAEMGFDEIGDAPKAPGVECAAYRRQRFRGGRQVGIIPDHVNPERCGQGFHQHLSGRRRIGHLGMDRPGNLLDQGIAKAAPVMQVDSAGIDIDFPNHRSRQRQGGKEEVDALLNIPVEVDHVFANAVGTEPDRDRDRVAMLQPAIAAPPYMQPALEHDDDFRLSEPFWKERKNEQQNSKYRHGQEAYESEPEPPVSEKP